MQRAFQQENEKNKTLEWEIEDYISSDILLAFVDENPTAVQRVREEGGLTHRDFTRDGKARLHRFVKENALHKDLTAVVEVLSGFRQYFGISETA